MNCNFEDDLKPAKGGKKYTPFNWDDSDKVKALNRTRSRQFIKLYVKLKKAKKDGDDETFRKTMEALRKHEAKNKIFKAYAEEAGNDWD